MLDICTEVLRTPYQHNTTFFIHKKGDPSLPENFKSFTFELVNLKISTSFLQNRVFTYLISNQFIESYHQKGFMPGMSGTFEHKAEMSYIINHSRNIKGV